MRSFEEMAFVAYCHYSVISDASSAYDADGNMTSDGRFHYFWNGENRLVCASNAEVVVTYAYDHRGRMVTKTLCASASLRLIKNITYIWDDWNIIREVVREGDSVAVTDNVWGLDLDGTLQGTGGVGGLLAVVRDDGVFLPTYDANGNVSEYVSTNGEIVAHYGYSPFGEPLVASGPLAPTFTHQFSTKPYCSVTGFSEYQMRKYSPEIGRWISRDSVSEIGANALYFCERNRAFSQLENSVLMALISMFSSLRDKAFFNTDCLMAVCKALFHFVSLQSASLVKEMPVHGYFCTSQMTSYDYLGKVAIDLWDKPFDEWPWSRQIEPFPEPGLGDSDSDKKWYSQLWRYSWRYFRENYHEEIAEFTLQFYNWSKQNPCCALGIGAVILPCTYWVEEKVHGGILIPHLKIGLGEYWGIKSRLECETCNDCEKESIKLKLTFSLTF